ncbi:hypothetical protein [Methylobacterium sp. ap11]|uniref:hypothetical protein n=1 Tax=Methylobacterium sp. ap11 TaxID=1761799 RepID=UPI001160DC16|nr:hypothetical protein [Methylobacterium sp. ap11]
MPSINEAHAINALVMRARLWQFRFITADGEAEKALATKSFSEMDAALGERMARYRGLISSPAEEEIFGSLSARIVAFRADWARLKGLPGQAEIDAYFRGPMNATYRATIDTAGKLVALDAVAMLAVLVLVTLATVLFCLVRVVRPHDRRDALPGLALGPDIPIGMRCAATGQRLTQRPQRSTLWDRDFAIAEQAWLQRMCDSSATRASAEQSFRTARASLGRVAPQR